MAARLRHALSVMLLMTTPLCCHALSHVTRYVEDRALIVEVEEDSLAEKVNSQSYR